MQDLIDAEFKKMDCLNVLIVAKQSGPLFTSADIERISKSFRQNHSSLLSNIFIDEDN